MTRRAALLGTAGMTVGVLAATAASAAQDATPGAGNGVAPGVTLTVEGALAVLNAALDEATSLGVPEAIAVVDGAGDLKAFARMDGTFNTSIDLAMDKAFTAASFHAPTEQFGASVSADAATMASLLNEPHISLLPGGIPLMSGQTVIGAVGCSGGSGEQDVQCAQAGVGALES